MTEPLIVALLGLGTVGTGTARLLAEASTRIAARAGRPIRLKWVVVRDLGKFRPYAPAGVTCVDDPRPIWEDPSVHVVVEAIGGMEPALSWVLKALASGKDVVTANKALLAEEGPRIFAEARRFGRSVSFEASVGGGIPIIAALGESLAANRIQGLAAILNGTCNFILTSMTRDGLAYAEALRLAQERGYAEADPSLDVDGTDTAHKLAVLAQVAFGKTVTTADFSRQGIDNLALADLQYAGELGYAIKLLALAHVSGEALMLRVAPTLVRRGTPLAEVSGPDNAIRVVGDAVGDTFFSGRGAGMMPTASAIVGDLIDVATGRARLTFDSLGLWPSPAPPARFTTPEQNRSRYYLRFTVADRPGVLGAIAQVLGNHGVSIASVIQHDPGDDSPQAPVPLVMMTHLAIEASLRDALETIDRLDVVRAPSVCLGVAE